MVSKKLKSQSSKLKTKVQSSKLSVDVLDIKGKKSGSVLLPKEVFGAKINPKLMAQAVRVYLANQRQGTVATKTRGEVKGSSRKIYRQKGTGRARHGSIRAPIFVKGGIVFGPKPRDFSLSLSKKMKKAALFSAISSKLKDGEIKVVSGLESIEPKTKEMALVFKNINISSEKLAKGQSLAGRKVLLVLPKHLDNVWKSARNIKGVDVTTAGQLNTYDVLDNSWVLFLKDAIAVLKHE